MKNYGEFTLYTTMKEIREIQAQKEPSPHDIRIHPACSHYTKGFAVALFNNAKQEYEIRGTWQTEEEVVESIRLTLEGCRMFPECFGNFATRYSDIYIFGTDGYVKPNWGLHGILVYGS